MLNKLQNLKQIHGQIINNEVSILDDIFNKSKTEIFSAAQKNIKEMSLEELKIIAEELNIVPEDNKLILLKSIQKELSKN